MALVPLLLSLAVLLTPNAHAQNAQASGQLPTRGIFKPFVSLAGVGLGMTQAQVTKVLGKNYIICTVKISRDCKEPAWLYEYPRGEPLGVGIKFHNLKVSAVFTLGAINGWKTSEGLKVFDPVSNIYTLYPAATLYSACTGYEAYSMRKGTVTTTFYQQSGTIYGFALTSPTEAICQ